MKILHRAMPLFLLAVLWAGVLMVPAAATVTTSMEHEGLEITVEMDKEQYDPNEPITATITVTNTNAHPVTIANLEQLIPEGYQLAEDSEASLENVEMRPNRSIVLKVTFVGETETAGEGEVVTEDFFGTLLYGYTWGIPNLLIAVVVVIAIVVFMLLT